MNEQDLINLLLGAAKGGQWVVAAGAGLMILIAVCRWLLKMLDKEFPSEYVAWATTILATLGTVGTTLIGKLNVPWWKAALSGLVIGATSSGLWSLAGKHFVEWLKVFVKRMKKV